ncbi:MAG: MBL fold metallo-hydrolase [Sphingobacteriales bacterium]
MEIVKNVFKFDSGPFNWYIIKQNNRLTLVDAGFPGHYAVFLKGLSSIGHSIKDLEAIVLTHAHADHTGFAEKLRKQTNVPVFIHKNDVKMAGKPLQLPWFGLLSNAWRPYTATMLGVAIINGVFTFPHLTKTVAIEHHQRLDIPGSPLVIHTPGHTDGEIALLLEDYNVLISGDTLVTRNLLTGQSGKPQITNPILTANYKQANHSLDLLREIGTVTMLPGHGAPWKGSIKEAIAIARENMEADFFYNSLNSIN